MVEIVKITEPVAEKKYPPLPNPPYHVGIIMDGNGRWAKSRGKMRIEGHKAGTENLRRILEHSVEFGVKMLTIYAFSTENWKRPPLEVMGLMNILENVIDRELPELHKNGVQLRHLGKLERLRPAIREKVKYAIELTKNNDRLILNVAFNYGGRDEIVQAVKNLIRDNVKPEEVTEDLLSKYMYTGSSPDPELIIRTSGEFRTSNFLIWQAAYAEYYITPVYWPDFDKDEYYKALHAFSQRERRFGDAK
ncbi:MAG: di-trans,poly-cis-decaprenylcistransferase [Anaerolineales bacterium]|nr:di-trans,poly-cis-decaprenylcistransferase [Anaerolineales bacterium]